MFQAFTFATTGLNCDDTKSVSYVSRFYKERTKENAIKYFEHY